MRDRNHATSQDAIMQELAPRVHTVPLEPRWRRRKGRGPDASAESISASGANANNRRSAPPKAGLEIGTTLMRSKSSQRSSGGNDDGDVSIERDAGPRSDFEFGFLMTLADIDV